MKGFQLCCVGLHLEAAQWLKQRFGTEIDVNEGPVLFYTILASFRSYGAVDMTLKMCGQPVCSTRIRCTTCYGGCMQGTTKQTLRKWHPCYGGYCHSQSWTSAEKTLPSVAVRYLWHCFTCTDASLPRSVPVSAASVLEAECDPLHQHDKHGSHT